jgi:hypothetical protein
MCFEGCRGRSGCAQSKVDRMIREVGNEYTDSICLHGLQIRYEQVLGKTAESFAHGW